MRNLIKLIIVIGFALFVDAVFYEPYTLKVTPYNLQNSRLSGLKIVFAADFHVAPFGWEKKRLQNIINAINEQNPDLVVLGGDYINRHGRTTTMPPEDIAETFNEIKAPKVAILGNHDSYYGKDEVLKAFENAKIPVLDNRNIKLNLQNKEVYVAGVSDYDTDNSDVKKSLKNAGQPLIFVTHSPDVFVDLKGGADIVLAGHTHKGQVFLPYFGAVAVITKTKKKYIYGLFRERGMPMIVTSGLGTSMLPIRFNNLPEIVSVRFE